MLTGWKTIIFNVLTAVVGVLMATDFTTVVSDPKTAGYVVMGISIANMVLRAVTSTPVGSSTPK